MVRATTDPPTEPDTEPTDATPTVEPTEAAPTTAPPTESAPPETSPPPAPPTAAPGNPVPTTTAPTTSPVPSPAVPPDRPAGGRLGVRATTENVSLSPAYWNADSTVTTLRVTVTNTGGTTERIRLGYTLPAGADRRRHPGLPLLLRRLVSALLVLLALALATASLRRRMTGSPSPD